MGAITALESDLYADLWGSNSANFQETEGLATTMRYKASVKHITGKVIFSTENSIDNPGVGDTNLISLYQFSKTNRVVNCTGKTLVASGVQEAHLNFGIFRPSESLFFPFAPIYANLQTEWSVHDVGGGIAMSAVTSDMLTKPGDILTLARDYQAGLGLLTSCTICWSAWYFSK